MNMYKEKKNRHILHLTFCTALILLCLVINVRYNIFITNENEENNYSVNSKINNNKLEIKTTVAYINGKVGSEFPDDPGFGTTVYCHHIDNSEAAGVGELTYVYSDDTNTTGKWVLNVEGIEYADTICEVTFNELSEEPVSFATDSWTTIVNNTASSKYQIGDTKCVSIADLTNSYTADVEATCKANNEFTLRLVNKSYPSECNSDTFSQTACGFVVAFESALPIGSSAFDSTSGYANSTQETYLNSTFFERLPETLQNAIIDTRVVSGGAANAVYTTTDKIYLASVYEMESISTTDPAQAYTRQFDYAVSHYKQVTTGFKTRTCYDAGYADGRIHCNTWMYQYTSTYTYVWARMNYYAGTTYGNILPFFRIGT
jgi:hypothetical protein